MNLFSLHIESAFPDFVQIMLVGFVLLATALACVFAIKRLIKRHILIKSAVLILNVCAALSLLGLIFDVSYLSTKPTHIYLLTENVDTAELSKLAHSDAEIIWLKLHSGDESSNQIAQALLEQSLVPDDIGSITSISQLPLYYPNVEQLVLLGDGLSTAQFNELSASYAMAASQSSKSAQPFVVHKAYSRLLGLTDMRWSRHLSIGEFGQISGQVQGTLVNAEDMGSAQANKLYTLSLIDPFGNELESQRLRVQDTFSFTFQASVGGPWLYTLNLKEGIQSEPIVSEKLSVQVREAGPVKLMIKQSAPSFESRQLQNLLNEQGSKVLTLTQISKDRDIAQFTNLEAAEKELAKTPFSLESLGYFDMLIIDQRALAKLSQTQSSNLVQALKEGLGLLILADLNGIDDWQSMPGPFSSVISIRNKSSAPSSEQATFLRWQYQRLETPVKAIDASLFASSSGARVLVSEQMGDAVALSQGFGLGQLAISLFDSSYAFKTQGRADLHSHYWQWLIQNIARNSASMRWSGVAEDSLIQIYQQQSSCLLNTSEDAQLYLEQAGQRVGLHNVKQIIDNTSTCVSYWPRKQGWYSLFAKASDATNTRADYFAYSLADWRAWRQNIKQSATSEYLARQKEAKASVSEVWRSISNYWFWAILIFCSSMLWVERRLNDSNLN
jgi:hypothetical protein